MFKRKKPPEIEPERRRRSDVSVPPRATTYSYYANRQVSATPRPQVVSSRLRPSEEPEKTRWYKKKTLRFWMVLGVCFILLVELTFLSSNGKVVVIDGSGNLATDIDTSSYEKTVDGLLGGSILNHNKLTVDANGITTKMQQAHPELESVTVVTPLIGTRPSVYIRVSEPVFTLKQNSTSYILSESGYIVSRGAVDGLPVITDETGEPVTVAKRLLPSSHVTFMSTVWYQLTKQGIAADSFILPKEKAFEVDVRLKGKPYYLKFNIAEDAKRQSGAAVAVIKQLGTTSPHEYIDLRVPGKAYYK